MLAKGWGYAILIPTSIQADNGAGLTEGIIGLCNKGQPRKVDDWGALRAWAWGASRALDYFETDKAVDAKQVGIEGHSRYGKAAIVTMAYDERFAIAFVSSSGEGGVKLHRRNWGELVENVAGYGRVPLDGRQLPQVRRPAEVERPAGGFARAGRPVRSAPGVHQRRRGQGGGRLGGRQGHVPGRASAPVRSTSCWARRTWAPPRFPPIETALIDGDVAFRQHSGGHTTGPNWPTFLKFADRYLKCIDRPSRACSAAE